MFKEQIIAGGILPLALFIFGTIVGSFIYAQAFNWFNKPKSRSQCPNCKTKLGFYDLFPVLSYLILWGNCRYCQTQISVRYFLMEVISGLFFLLAYLKLGLSAELILVLTVFSAGMLACLVDYKTQILPDKIIITLGILLIGNYSLNNFFNFLPIDTGWDSWWAGFLVGGLVIGSIFAITLGSGIGLGDAKFAAVLGITLGGPKTLLMLFLAFVIGAVFGIIVIILKKADKKTAIPFGPFIFLGWILAMLWGENILIWYNSISI